VQPERLTKRAPKGDVIVRAIWRHIEGGITRLPATLRRGSKSNSLSDTDQVQFVVQDRKEDAVSKFFLMDLELLAA
jgi:hypothetical protein